MTTFILLASLLVALTLAWLFRRPIGIILASAMAVCVGCSKPVDSPKPQPIRWSSPEAGYHSESVPPDKTGTPKKEP